MERATEFLHTPKVMDSRTFVSAPKWLGPDELKKKEEGESPSTANIHKKLSTFTDDRFFKGRNRKKFKDDGSVVFPFFAHFLSLIVCIAFFQKTVTKRLASLPFESPSIETLLHQSVT